MQEVFKILIGVGVLILGFPIGILLARLTQEELRVSQVWFKLIILASFIGAVVSLIIENDTLLFSFLFFAAVTSMSLRNKQSSKKREREKRKS